MSRICFRENNGSAETLDFDSLFSDYFESFPDGDLPYYDPEDKKLRSSLMNIRQLPPSEAALLVRQFGFNTITTTVTVIKSKTVTSYPACSSQGILVQCTKKRDN